MTISDRRETSLSRASTGVLMDDGVVRFSRDSRVLYIEADELGPSAATRLRRGPDCGLARALGRIAHGHPALPEGLSPPDRHGAPVGKFDAICGTNLPGGPPIVNPVELVALADEALAVYDEVVVQTHLLVAASAEAGRDRFAAGLTMLARADRVVVVAGSDPDGAMRLVNWLSAACSAGVTGPVWAVFSRAPTGAPPAAATSGPGWPGPFRTMSGPARSPASTSCPRIRRWPPPSGTPSWSGRVDGTRR